MKITNTSKKTKGFKGLALVVAMMFLINTVATDYALGLQVPLKTPQEYFKGLGTVTLEKTFLAELARFIENDQADEFAKDFGKVDDLGKLFLKEVFIRKNLKDLITKFGLDFEFRKNGQSIPMQTLGDMTVNRTPAEVIGIVNGALDEIRVKLGNGAIFLRYYTMTANPADPADSVKIDGWSKTEGTFGRDLWYSQSFYDHLLAEKGKVQTVTSPEQAEHPGLKPVAPETLSTPIIRAGAGLSEWKTSIMKLLLVVCAVPFFMGAGWGDIAVSGYTLPSILLLGIAAAVLYLIVDNIRSQKTTPTALKPRALRVEFAEPRMHLNAGPIDYNPPKLDEQLLVGAPVTATQAPAVQLLTPAMVQSQSQQAAVEVTVTATNGATYRIKWDKQANTMALGFSEGNHNSSDYDINLTASVIVHNSHRSSIDTYYPDGRLVIAGPTTIERNIGVSGYNQTVTWVQGMLTRATEAVTNGGTVEGGTQTDIDAVVSVVSGLTQTVPVLDESFSVTTTGNVENPATYITTYSKENNTLSVAADFQHHMTTSTIDLGTYVITTTDNYVPVTTVYYRDGKTISYGPNGSETTYDNGAAYNEVAQTAAVNNGNSIMRTTDGSQDKTNLLVAQEVLVDLHVEPISVIAIDANRSLWVRDDGTWQLYELRGDIIRHTDVDLHGTINYYNVPQVPGTGQTDQRILYDKNGTYVNGDVSNRASEYGFDRFDRYSAEVNRIKGLLEAWVNETSGYTKQVLQDKLDLFNADMPRENTARYYYDSQNNLAVRVLATGEIQVPVADQFYNNVFENIMPESLTASARGMKAATLDDQWAGGTYFTWHSEVFTPDTGLNGVMRPDDSQVRDYLITLDRIVSLMMRVDSQVRNTGNESLALEAGKIRMDVYQGFGDAGVRLSPMVVTAPDRQYVITRPDGDQETWRVRRGEGGAYLIEQVLDVTQEKTTLPDGTLVVRYMRGGAEIARTEGTSESTGIKKVFYDKAAGNFNFIFEYNERDYLSVRAYTDSYWGPVLEIKRGNADFYLASFAQYGKDESGYPVTAIEGGLPITKTVQRTQPDEYGWSDVGITYYNLPDQLYRCPVKTVVKVSADSTRRITEYYAPVDDSSLGPRTQIVEEIGYFPPINAEEMSNASGKVTGGAVFMTRTYAAKEGADIWTNPVDIGGPMGDLLKADMAKRTMPQSPWAKASPWVEPIATSGATANLNYSWSPFMANYQATGVTIDQYNNSKITMTSPENAVYQFETTTLPSGIIVPVRITGVMYGNGTRDDYAFRPDNSLESIKHVDGAGTVLSTITMDENGTPNTLVTLVTYGHVGATLEAKVGDVDVNGYLYITKMTTASGIVENFDKNQVRSMVLPTGEEIVLRYDNRYAHIWKNAAGNVTRISTYPTADTVIDYDVDGTN
ncbi:MAG: hypothetical protein PHS37_09045, partial [Candidatus Omnitrophica bacterium]|nr:hypothetical protein [Candidatus Omnitrophota bacterium]